MLEFPTALVESFFIRRLNRFAALVELDGAEVMVHVANSGRLRELLETGRRLLLRPAEAPHRKTDYDIALADLGHTLCSMDARLPPHLVAEAFRQGRLPEFAGYDAVRKEVTIGESRIDLQFTGPEGVCFVETKSATLVEEGGVALFPDAPTERGRKHLRSLAAALRPGVRAAAVFVIQRSDAQAFRPHDTADEPFGQALRDAAAQGVEVYAYTCAVTVHGIELAAQAPVLL